MEKVYIVSQEVWYSAYENGGRQEYGAYRNKESALKYCREEIIKIAEARGHILSADEIEELYIEEYDGEGVYYYITELEIKD